MLAYLTGGSTIAIAIAIHIWYLLANAINCPSLSMAIPSLFSTCDMNFQKLVSLGCAQASQAKRWKHNTSNVAAWGTRWPPWWGSAIQNPFLILDLSSKRDTPCVTKLVKHVWRVGEVFSARRAKCAHVSWVSTGIPMCTFCHSSDDSNKHSRLGNPQ